MGSQVLATIASVIMKLLVLFCVASFLVISSEGTVSRKNADEAVSEADAEGVYGVGLGDSPSSLEKRSAQPLGRRRGRMPNRRPRVGKKADEAVVEADAEGVYGVGLGDSLSTLEKRSAQPLGRRRGRGRRIGKKADEAVVEADAEGVYGVGLGDSL